SPTAPSFSPTTPSGRGRRSPGSPGPGGSGSTGGGTPASWGSATATLRGKRFEPGAAGRVDGRWEGRGTPDPDGPAVGAERPPRGGQVPLGGGAPPARAREEPGAERPLRAPRRYPRRTALPPPARAGARLSRTVPVPSGHPPDDVPGPRL